MKNRKIARRILRHARWYMQLLSSRTVANGQAIAILFNCEMEI